MNHQFWRRKKKNIYSTTTTSTTQARKEARKKNQPQVAFSIGHSCFFISFIETKQKKCKTKKFLHVSNVYFLLLLLLLPFSNWFFLVNCLSFDLLHSNSIQNQKSTVKLSIMILKIGVFEFFVRFRFRSHTHIHFL